MRSSSSQAFSCSLTTYSFLLLLHLTTANGFKFNPLIQLPTSVLHRNTSRTVLLDIRDFGAKGEIWDTIDATKPLQDAWKVACSSSSPAKILIPKKTFYLVRPTNFSGPCKSKVTLKVSGFITAPRDPEEWQGLDVHKWLYFHGVNRLTIQGNGSIDGSGKKWWDRSCKKNESNPCTRAPTALTFHKCKNLKVRNITLLNGQQMHMAFTNCTNVVASGVNIIAPSDSPNTDGVHISSSTRVALDDIVISTGDDCISIVGNSSKIDMVNIFCGAGHGISIGSLGKSNSRDEVQDIYVNRAFLINTENGLRIKTWQGGSGFARQIAFQNVWMHNVSNPILINQYYCDSPLPCLNQTSSVIIEEISFRGIRGTSATEDAITFACSDNYPCKKIFLENIEITSSSGIVKSSCWEAYGVFAGSNFPPPCISSGEIIIKHNVKPNSTRGQRRNYGFF